jgi:hypothetical protein
MFIERIKKFFSGEKSILEREPATPKSATLPNGIPDLGPALLQPGPAARKITLPVPVVKPPEPTPEVPEPIPAAVAPFDVDYDRVDLPPRSPEEIQRLIDAGETPEARARRILNDKARYRRQKRLE